MSSTDAFEKIVKLALSDGYLDLRNLISESAVHFLIVVVVVVVVVTMVACKTREKMGKNCD